MGHLLKSPLSLLGGSIESGLVSSCCVDKSRRLSYNFFFKLVIAILLHSFNKKNSGKRYFGDLSIEQKSKFRRSKARFWRHLADTSAAERPWRARWAGSGSSSGSHPARRRLGLRVSENLRREDWTNWSKNFGRPDQRLRKNEWRTITES